MSLAGQAVVAIWNGIAEEGRTDFYEWHNREHMPERVGIPGFEAGRRWFDWGRARHRYFTLSRRGRSACSRPRSTARGWMRRAISGKAPSSTSSRPSWAPRSSISVEVTPETRFAPERLWASRTRGERIVAASDAVVVFPFEPVTATMGSFLKSEI